MKELEERIAACNSMQGYSELNELLKKRADQVMNNFKQNFQTYLLKKRDEKHA